MSSLDSELTMLNETGLKCAAVHAESNQSNFFAAPVEGPISVTLRLPFAVPFARHIIGHMQDGEGRDSEPDAVTEMRTHTNNLMLAHVKAVVGIVVAR